MNPDSKNKRDRKAPRRAETPEEPGADDQATDTGGAEEADVEPQPDSELEQLREQRDELLGRLQRVSADYQNYKKRVQRDIAHAHEYANEGLIKAMLGVLDDMERALTAARENHDENDPLLQGMQIVHDNALATLEKFGVERIDAEGKPFDPELHQAVMQQPADEPPMTVLQEVQTGYRLKDRTIRPSSVIVSQGPKQPDEAADEEQPED